MEFFGTVSGEGGPLVFADASRIGIWDGIDGSSYEELCSFLEIEGNEQGGKITPGGEELIVWELQGAGTADVLRASNGSLLIIRSWLNSSEGTNEVFTSQPRSKDATLLGEIQIKSDFLGVLWAPENGSCVEELSEGRPSGEMSLDDGGWIVRCESGNYSFWHDNVQTADGDARRLWIERDN